MTPSGASRLQNLISDTSLQAMLANTWLLAPGVSHAFRNGHLQVRPRGAKDWNEFEHADASPKAEVSTCSLSFRTLCTAH
jgi:hypothetical protein